MGLFGEDDDLGEGFFLAEEEDYADAKGEGAKGEGSALGDKASFSYLFGSEEPALSPGCLSLAVIFASVLAGILYYFVTVRTNLPVKILFTDFLRMGMWVSLGMTVYLSLELRRMDKTVPGAFLTLGFLVAGLMVLIFGRDYYAAKVFILTLITLICLLVGSGKLKSVLVLGFVVYLGLGIVVVTRRIITLFPLYAWIFSGEPELSASYGVILQRSVFRLAGFWGQGGDYIDAVGLMRPENLPLNGLPYFSLLAGWLGVGLFFLLLILLMGGLLLNSFKIPSFRDRAAALGVWCFLAINQYLSVFVIFSPKALMIWDSPFGLPFIGSFQTSFQLLLLAILVFRNQKPV
jgi:hypothetical protein